MMHRAGRSYTCSSGSSPSSMEAAAAGLLPATYQVFFDKLVGFAIKEGESILEVNENLKTLIRTLLRVQAFLQEADEKHFDSAKAWCRVLLRDLEDAAFDAEDLVDEIAIKLSRRRQVGNHHQNNDINQVRSLVFASFMMTTPRNVVNVLNRLSNIFEETKNSLMVGLRDRNVEIIEEELQTISLIDECRVFGRATDVYNIVKMLMDINFNERRFFVVSIVGMPGVGKTTLAQLIYNKYRANLVTKVWVSACSNFNVNEIWRSIIARATSTTCDENLTLELLQCNLKSSLNLNNSDSNFIIVLDNVWHVDKSKWDLLLAPLKHTCGKGLIVITSRSDEISSLMDGAATYTLKPLSDEDCWKLLEKQVFGDVDAHTPCPPPSLISIGEKIAKKCQGLPWASKMLGQMMKATMNEKEWTAILESNMWDLPEVPRNLYLRSHCLPARLKQCFAYCAIFPKDHEFLKDVLVTMWMAEGFIIHEGFRRIEDIGSKYFDNLLSMSLFQCENRKYKMHNLLHELAHSISGVKCFRMEGYDSMPTEYVRYLSMLIEREQAVTFENLYICKGLRTLVLLCEYGSCVKGVPFDLFKRLARLRVLDLSNTHVSVLTEALGNLIHLRYLNLSNTHIEWLPETIGKLYKLQTLVLKNCLYLYQLPECTRNLINLHHLELEGNQLASMPLGFGQLINLQTLTEFIVGMEGGRISELHNVDSIQGSLCITKLENVREEDTSEHILNNKKFLQKLQLQWDEMQVEGAHMQVLERLQPHENLKELTIRQYGGVSFPRWVADSAVLLNLVSIRLLDCRNCDFLPPLGNLKMLESLEIDNMPMVGEINSAFYGNEQDVTGFPSLKTLELRDMDNLTSWVDMQNHDMRVLQKLKIENCPQLSNLPALHHLESLSKLELIFCSVLPTLPQEGFPHCLQSLVITDCPILVLRCQDGGEDWHKIQNIPHREIQI